MNVTDKISFFSSLLDKMGLTPTNNRLSFLLLWSNGEDTAAANNPLATTQVLSADVSSTDFNSAGVKNYSTPEYGVDATLKTLTNGRYDAIVDSLKNDITPQQAISNEQVYGELNTWGTSGASVEKIINSQYERTINAIKMFAVQNPKISIALAGGALLFLAAGIVLIIKNRKKK